MLCKQNSFVLYVYKDQSDVLQVKLLCLGGWWFHKGTLPGVLHELWTLPSSQQLHKLSCMSLVTVLCFCFNIMSFLEQNFPLCLNVRELYLVSSMNSGHLPILNGFAGSAFESGHCVDGIEVRNYTEKCAPGSFLTPLFVYYRVASSGEWCP